MNGSDFLTDHPGDELGSITVSAEHPFVNGCINKGSSVASNYW